MYVELIAAHHDTESFTCGEPEVDDFLRFKAIDEEHGQTWVVVSQAGSSHIIAFYTINPDPITGIEYDEYNEHPVGFVMLEMLGVDKRYQRRGIGTRLLWRLVRQVLMVANQHSINALFLTALNQRAKDWYLNSDLDFQEAASGSMHLLLPVATMRLLADTPNSGLPPDGF